MNKWFGAWHPAPAYLDTPEVETPVGAPCGYCEETILAGDDGFIDAGGKPFHRACFLRMVIGSVAHVQHRCSCFVQGAHEGDPPGMTLREGAEAALEAFKRSNLRAVMKENGQIQ